MNSVTVAGECRSTDSCDGHYRCHPDTGEKICSAGYKGAECKERDVQGDDPACPTIGRCKNGGTCWNHTCCCAKGYEGQLCGSDIIECRSSPCTNGGACFEGGVGEYRCKCPEGKIKLAYTDECPEGKSKLVHTCVSVQKVRLIKLMNTGVSPECKI